VTMTMTSAGALQQLIKFVNQRAGIEPGNYGSMQSYRSESRSVTRDLHEFRKVLAEAYALGVTDEHVTEAAPHAFSGRLEWNGQDWNYCTGQYFPTEYRKAARVVLEHAISAYKQAHASDVPKPQFLTVADVRAYHQQTGGHWFDRSTMRYFGTKIHTKGLLICGKYFITSEQPPHGPRGYTVREVKPDGDISTVGELCGYRSAQMAAIAARLKG
jgi:hypothetical protein